MFRSQLGGIVFQRQLAGIVRTLVRPPALPRGKRVPPQRPPEARFVHDLA